MFCSHCGAEIEDDIELCPNCGCSTGIKEESELQKSEEEAKKFGNLSLCFCWFPILGVVFGVRCIIKDKLGKHKIKGIIAIVISIVVALAVSFVSGFLKG